MARDSRRRRHRRRRTPIAAGTCTGDGEQQPTRPSIHDLPDDLLELVLLHVQTPVCLFRAAATCKLWRRVITKDGFLQRVRSLHRRNHLLGHYSVKPTRPGFSPSVVAEFVPFPARPAVHLRQRLSLDFLIDGEDMRRRRSPVLITDSHGGLLAFLRDNWSGIVCDPWTRQYRVIDFPWEQPDDEDRMLWFDCLGAFFLDAGDSDGDDKKSSIMLSFSMLCVCLIKDVMGNTTTAVACVFSARENAWIRRTVSSDNFTDVVAMGMDQRFLGRVGGSIFFGIETYHGSPVVLVLDEATGDFSTIKLPLPLEPVYSYLYNGRAEKLRVVNGGTGTLVHIIRLVNSDLEVLKATRTHGGWECTVERSVDLCQMANIEFRARSWRFLDTTAVAAAATTLVLGTLSPSTWFFSLDVETIKLQRANKQMRKKMNAKRVFPYELPWPQTII